MARSPLDPHGALAPMTRPPLTEEERIAYEQRLALAQERTAIDVPPPITPDPVPLQTMDATVPEGFDPAAAPPPSLPVQTMEATAPAGFDPSALEPATGGMPEAYESGVAQPATPLASLARTQDPAAIMAPVQEKAAEVRNSLQSLARTPEPTPMPESEMSTRRMTESEMSAMPLGFQNIARDVRPSGQLPERAPWGAYGDTSSQAAYEQAQMGMPMQEGFGAPEQAAWRSGASPAAAGREAKLAMISRMPPKPEDPRLAVARTNADAKIRAAQIAADAKRRRGGRGGGGGPRPAGVASEISADAIRAKFEARGIPIPEKVKAALGRAGETLNRQERERALRSIDDLSDQYTGVHDSRERAANTLSGRRAGREASLVESFNTVNKPTGLYVPPEGEAAFLNANTGRAVAKVRDNITTVNRALAASAEFTRLEAEYAKIPPHERAGSRAREIAGTYKYLRDEHLGIIMKIAGMGVGSEDQREEILNSIPDLETNPHHFASARLRGLHNMLRLNGEAMLQNYGIKIGKGTGHGGHGAGQAPAHGQAPQAPQPTAGVLVLPDGTEAPDTPANRSKIETAGLEYEVR